MIFLILTNPSHVDFVLKSVLSLRENKHEFLVRAFGEYDFVEDYDVGISFMYPYKVPEEHVNNKLWINFHPGPLPEYKGRNLCYHAIMNGEKEFGASVHIMDAEFDAGPIIEVVIFPVSDSYTSADLSRDVMISSRDLFLRWLPKIVRGDSFSSKENRGGTYFHKTQINDFLELPEHTKREIRAITYGNFNPKVNIGGVIYKIVRDE